MVSPGHTQIPKGSSDFLLEVAKGNLPGHSSIPIGAESPFMTNTGFIDIWDFNTNLVYATTAESLELVSDSPNDTAAGTGARSVSVEGLDSGGNFTAAVSVVMDGTTPVAVPGTYVRTSIIGVLTAGSGDFNEGNITLRVAGGGANRLRIRAGLNNSFSSHRTIPLGFVGFVVILNESAPRNDSIRIRVGTRLFDNVFQSSTLRHVYQNNDSGELLATPLLPELTDIKFVGKGAAPNSEISISYQVVLIEDAYVPNSAPEDFMFRVVGGHF